MNAEQRVAASTAAYFAMPVEPAPVPAIQAPAPFDMLVDAYGHLHAAMRWADEDIPDNRAREHVAAALVLVETLMQANNPIRTRAA